MKIKVCGLTNAEQVYILDDYGIDFLGFIFYSGSSRFVHNFMDAAAMRALKLKNAKKVGVFVNETASAILETVQSCGLDMVQLHGEEPPAFCEQLANHIPAIKAIRLKGNAAIEWKVNPYKDVVDMLLFDTDGAGYGGTGEKFNWELLQQATIHIPFILSGGIAPQDATAIKAFSATLSSNQLSGIDINSRFELEPGVKNIPVIQTFVQEFNQKEKEN